MRSIEILILITISFLGLLGTFLLSSPRSRQLGFHWLGIFFLLLGLNFLDGILLLNGTLLHYPRFAFWEDPMVLLYGPLIYFFSLQFSFSEWKWSFRTLFHFIPFLVLEAYITLFHHTHSNESIQQMVAGLLEQPSSAKFLIVLLPLYLHILTYVFLARKKLIHHKETLKQYYSQIDLSWAFSLINVVTVIFLCALLGSLAQNLGPRSLFQVLILVINGIAIGLCLHLLLKALNQPLFQQTPRLSPVTDLPKEEIARIKEKITRLLLDQKVYSNPDITLKEVAAAIGHTDRVVSYVINQHLAENFYDLINGYRIIEAKRIFEESADNKLTVLEVLYQVGFNSKSSFNTEFKKRTGMTPSGYKSSLK